MEEPILKEHVHKYLKRRYPESRVVRESFIEEIDSRTHYPRFDFCVRDSKGAVRCVVECKRSRALQTKPTSV